jgi:uncharacterized protein YbjT (DUF2867 family)
MESGNIVVCGATGHQGGATIDALLRRTHGNVVALSRNPESDKSLALRERGVRVVKADLGDKGSLIEAFRGADAVFGVTQPFSSDYRKSDPEGEVDQGRNIVDACADTGVGHLVLSTVLGLNIQGTGVSHLDSKSAIVAHLKETRLNYTILRPASFMDNIGSSFFPVRKGHVRGFTDGDVKIPYIAVKDIGEIAALVLEHPGLYRGKELDLAADLVSGEELARTLSKIRNGAQFRYTAIPRLPMRLFAREFYQMRVSFEKGGRPPYNNGQVDAAIRASKEMHPQILTLEQYLLFRKFDSMAL